MPWKKISCEQAKSDLHFLKGSFQMYELAIEKFKETGEGADELSLEKESVEGYSELLYDGLPDIEMSIKKAKEIMGEDFYGPERFKEVFGNEMEVARLGRVPFTVTELINAKHLGFYLMARGEDDSTNITRKLDHIGFNIDGAAKAELEHLLPVAHRWVLAKKEQGLDEAEYNTKKCYEHFLVYAEAAESFLKPAELNEFWYTIKRRYKNILDTIHNSNEEWIVKFSWLEQADVSAGLDQYSTSLQEELYDLLMRSNGGKTETVYSREPIWTSTTFENDSRAGFVSVAPARFLLDGADMLQLDLDVVDPRETAAKHFRLQIKV